MRVAYVFFLLCALVSTALAGTTAEGLRWLEENKKKEVCFFHRPKISARVPLVVPASLRVPCPGVHTYQERFSVHIALGFGFSFHLAPRELRPSTFSIVPASLRVPCSRVQTSRDFPIRQNEDRVCVSSPPRACAGWRRTKKEVCFFHLSKIQHGCSNVQVDARAYTRTRARKSAY